MGIVSRARREARRLKEAMRDAAFDWPKPITVKVADITDEAEFPNIAEARRWARKERTTP